MYLLSLIILSLKHKYILDQICWSLLVLFYLQLFMTKTHVVQSRNQSISFIFYSYSKNSILILIVCATQKTKSEIRY